MLLFSSQRESHVVQTGLWFIIFMDDLRALPPLLTYVSLGFCACGTHPAESSHMSLTFLMMVFI